MSLSAKIEKGQLVLSLPVEANPMPSKSGKTILVATTRGPQSTTVIHDGKPLIVSINAYVK
jgi:hypothetical protein